MRGWWACESAAAAQEVKRVQFLQGRLAVDIPARELFGSSSDARFFTFESSSQLTRMVLIRCANGTVTYYKFAKSSNVRENGVYRRQLDERLRIFDTTLGDGEQSPAIRDKLHHFF